MKTQSKYKFIADIWIAGSYKGEQILGRTFLRNNRHYAILITENAKELMVDFDELKNIKILNLSKKIPPVTSSFQHKKRRSAADKLILELITSINK